ncbi:MAG: hypothetical protein ACUVT2_10215 [Thiobacillaceae bacterium]
MRPVLLFALVCATGLAGASPPAVFSVHNLDRDGRIGEDELLNHLGLRPGRGGR